MNVDKIAIFAWVCQFQTLLESRDEIINVDLKNEIQNKILRVLKLNENCIRS